MNNALWADSLDDQPMGVLRVGMASMPTPGEDPRRFRPKELLTAGRLNQLWDAIDAIKNELAKLREEVAKAPREHPVIVPELTISPKTILRFQAHQPSPMIRVHVWEGPRHVGDVTDKCILTEESGTALLGADGLLMPTGLSDSKEVVVRVQFEQRPFVFRLTVEQYCPKMWAFQTVKLAGDGRLVPARPEMPAVFLSPRSGTRRHLFNPSSSQTGGILSGDLIPRSQAGMTELLLFVLCPPCPGETVRTIVEEDERAILPPASFPLPAAPSGMRDVGGFCELPLAWSGSTSRVQIRVKGGIVLAVAGRRGLVPESWAD